MVGDVGHPHVVTVDVRHGLIAHEVPQLHGAVGGTGCHARRAFVQRDCGVRMKSDAPNIYLVACSKRLYTSSEDGRWLEKDCPARIANTRGYVTEGTWVHFILTQKSIAVT